MKLNPVRICWRQAGDLVDDSIIRGPHPERLCACARGRGEGGAHAHLVPADHQPMFYGVDTPSKKDLIAANSRLRRSASLLRRTRWRICRCGADPLVHAGRAGARYVSGKLLHSVLHRRLSDRVGGRGGLLPATVERRSRPASSFDRSTARSRNDHGSHRAGSKRRSKWQG